MLELVPGNGGPHRRRAGKENSAHEAQEDPFRDDPEPESPGNAPESVENEQSKAYTEAKDSGSTIQSPTTSLSGF
jgi:hypothetical protein